MPSIPNFLSHRSSKDYDKDLDAVITVDGQISNAFVKKYENVNEPFTDKKSLISYHDECRNSAALSSSKMINDNLEINNNTCSITIPSPDLLHYKRNKTASPHVNENIAAHSQVSSDMLNKGQAFKCDRDSYEHSEIVANTHTIFKILKPSKILMDPCGMTRHYYGNVLPNMEEKVILLLGASGSGKSTLVNFIANFFEDVKTPDDEKVIVAPSSMKTKNITAYTFCSTSGTSTAVTVIDTPGLNDSSGSEIRDHVNSLKTFLANTATHGLKIHSLGFVAQAHLVRLTSSERLVMDYVSTLFGEGVKDNIITLISFADVQESPPVVEAMKSYGIKTKNFLKFNNAVLNGSSVDVDDLDRVYWRTGYRSWRKVMKLLNDLLPLSVNAMKALQKEVYAKSVVESSVKDLNDGLLDFISIYDQGILKVIRSSSLQVWDLVTIAHHHLKHTPGESASVESLLSASVEKICCKESSQITEFYLRALSFYSSRKLDDCAEALIKSIHPVYVSARNIQNTKGNKKIAQNKKKKHDINYIQTILNGQILLFCHQCQSEHIMERIDEARIMDSVKKAVGYAPGAIVTFKCRECKCEGNIHGMNQMLNSGDIHNSFVSDVNGILHHAKKMLTNVVEKYSLPKSNMTTKDLLEYLMKEANAETNEFISEILEIKI